MPDIKDLEREANASLTPAQAVLGIMCLYGQDIEVDYDNALKWLTKTSEKGASRAIGNLARMYEQGWGTARDIDHARTLYERAAKAGEFLAYIYMGRLYREGNGVPRSDDTARSWYQRAVDQKERIMDCLELDEAIAFVEAENK